MTVFRYKLTHVYLPSRVPRLFFLIFQSKVADYMFFYSAGVKRSRSLAVRVSDLKKKMRVIIPPNQNLKGFHTLSENVKG